MMWGGRKFPEALFSIKMILPSLEKGLILSSCTPTSLTLCEAPAKGRMSMPHSPVTIVATGRLEELRKRGDAGDYGVEDGCRHCCECLT